MATRLPVNASSEAVARRIALDAAAKLPPAGFEMTVGDLVTTESPARPFDRVALQEQNVPADQLVTYVFTAEVTRVPKPAICPECGRRFDLLDPTDAAEWSAGHDCEVGESLGPVVNADGSPTDVTLRMFGR